MLTHFFHINWFHVKKKLKKHPKMFGWQCHKYTVNKAHTHTQENKQGLCVCEYFHAGHISVSHAAALRFRSCNTISHLHSNSQTSEHVQFTTRPCLFVFIVTCWLSVKSRPCHGRPLIVYILGCNFIPFNEPFLFLTTNSSFSIAPNNYSHYQLIWSFHDELMNCLFYKMS